MSHCDMPPLVVAMDHPSLQHLVPRFVELLSRESRRFDNEGIGDPNPSPSLVRKATDPQRRRFGAMAAGELIGVASLSPAGDVAVSIAPQHRGRDVGSRLLEHLATIAERDGHTELVMESTRRSRPMAVFGERFDWTTRDLGHGELELILRLRNRNTT